VGAGGNNISKAINVGTWSAVEKAGKVTVTYNFASSYTATQVHVDLACLPISKCAPGQYTYGNTFTGSGVSTFTTPGIPYPSCGPGGTAFLIIHAAVSQSTTSPCGQPVP